MLKPGVLQDGPSSTLRDGGTCYGQLPDAELMFDGKILAVLITN